MNFIQGVRHPVEYLTEKSECYGSNASKSALIWSSAIAAVFSFLVFLLASFGMSVAPVQAQMTLLPFAGVGALFIFLYIFGYLWFNAALTGLIARMLGGIGLISNQMLVSIWSGLPAIVMGFIIGLLMFFNLILLIESIFGMIILISLYVVIFIACFVYPIAAIAASQDVSMLRALAIILIQMTLMFAMSFGLSFIFTLLSGGAH